MELIVKTRDGTPVKHDVTKNTVRMFDSVGNPVVFVSAEDVPVAVESTVDVDWSGGDMVVTPEEGQVFSKLLIPRPGTAQPENIREGVNLAGLIGAMAAGGGGGNVAIKVVTVTGNGATTIVTHGLGVIPDIVVCVALIGTLGYSMNSDYFAVFGESTTAINAGIRFEENLGLYLSNGKIRGNSYVVGIDTTNDTMPIHNANAETVTIRKLTTGTTYYVYFISGLT